LKPPNGVQPAFRRPYAFILADDGSAGGSGEGDELNDNERSWCADMEGEKTRRDTLTRLPRQRSTAECYLRVGHEPTLDGRNLDRTGVATELPVKDDENERSRIAERHVVVMAVDERI
jgi:hypothetical protein